MLKVKRLFLFSRNNLFVTAYKVDEINTRLFQILT